MDERSLRALEYHRIKDILKGKCYSSTGAVYVESLKPSTDRDVVIRLQKETSEFCEIIKYDGGASLERFSDILTFLSRIEVEGSYIDGKAILKIADLAEVATNVYRSLSSKRDKYPSIWVIAQSLSDFKELRNEINRIITIEGDVADNASPALMKIRNQMETTRARISEKLEKMISSKSAVDYLSEKLVTLRDGRFVIPVKDTQKSSVEGVVHDRSSSGATVFVEPLAVLPLNNRLRELKSDERREIEIILIKLCDKIREESDRLSVSQDALSHIDFIHARAVLSDLYNGTTPEISDDSMIELAGARHPLLFIDGAMSPEKVVPLNFELGDKGSAIIITGPNTGGKTVALKNVGMAVLLSQSGLKVPAQTAHLGIFAGIYADIGDEQSIAMSLSTFSGHMKQICAAIDNADNNVLVLLDELGSGTDPVEGAALGEAIIESLTNRGALSIITTHLGALKILAGENPQIRNGSMEFDRKNLIPTYKFMPDIPGSSYAIEVAKKLGMAEHILKRAGNLVDSGHRNLEKLVTQLEENLAVVKNERDELNASRRAAADLEELYQDKLAKMKQWEKDSERLALEKSAEALSELDQKVEELISEITESKADKTVVKKTRRQLQERRESIKKKVRKIVDVHHKGINTASPGDMVTLNKMNTKAEVLTSPDDKGRLKVRSGNLILDVKISDLSQSPVSESEVKSSGVNYEKVESVNPELDLRGLTFDEAEPILERYLEDIYLAGVYEVRIIHGKGTGALRKKVTEYLKHHRLITEMRLGNFNEGGVGVTVIKVKS
ncbi:MAG: endonuclease MutS2 [candidate division Zixibacteria bacterium]|nr:endonuclease MutS2 [candidate division Zixibacteria bacterium]